MRKIIIYLALVFVALDAFAEEGATVQSLLGRVSQYVKQLGRYEVAFALRTGDYRAEGRYVVSGDAYYLTVGDAEVYSDGKVRYEVDNEREEVNVDVVDTSSHNILDNPTRCFDFAGSEYLSDVVRRDDKSVTIKLVSKDKSVEGEIFLTVDAATARPQDIEYRLYDDRFEVKITSIAKSKASPQKFDRNRYRNYEIIDFR